MSGSPTPGEPLVELPVPEHYVIGDKWQVAYYDPTATGAFGAWVSLDQNAGSCSLETGACNGDHFGDSGPWGQT